MVQNARFPVMDPNQYVVGKDAELYLANGDEAGEFLMHVGTWQLQGNIQTETEQPPGHQLVQAYETGVEFTLSLTETVIRVGDRWLLKKIMEGIYAGHTPLINFMGKIGGRTIALEGGRQSQIATVTIDACQPIGQFDLVNVRPGGALRRALNFHCNSVPWFDSFLE